MFKRKRILSFFVLMAIFFCNAFQVSVFADESEKIVQNEDVSVTQEITKPEEAELTFAEEDAHAMLSTTSDTLALTVKPENNGSATISWEGYSSADASYYVVYRNNDVAATLDRDIKTFNDKSSSDVINTYKVVAYDSNGEELLESEEKHCPLYSTNYVKAVQFFQASKRNNGDTQDRYMCQTTGSKNWEAAESDSVILLDGISLGAKNVNDTQGWNATCNIYDTLCEYDLTDLYADGYVKFLLYIKADSDISGNLLLNLRTNNGGALSAAAIDMNEVNKWQIVTVKLSDLAWNTNNSADRIKIVRGLTFTFKGSENVEFYVQDIGIWKNKIFNLSVCEEDDGYVNLEWTDDSSDVSYYEIIRNGEVIDSCSSTSYVDKTVLEDTIYTYKICSYDASGNQLDETLEKSTPVYDTSLMRVLTFFKNSKTDAGNPAERYAVSTNSGDKTKFVANNNGSNALIGGISFGADNCDDETGYTGNIQIYDKISAGYDMTNLYKTGYLKFLIYLSSEMLSQIKGDVQVALRTSAGIAVGKVNVPVKTTNQWTNVTVKLSDMAWNPDNSDQRIKMVSGISLFYKGVAGEPIGIYVQDVGVYDVAVRPSFVFESATIDEATTNFKVSLKVDGELKGDNLIEDLFEIDGTDCTSVVYDEENAKVTLLFDFIPSFPNEYTLTFDGHSIKNKNNVGMTENELVFKTLPYQNAIWPNTGSITSSVIDNRVSVTINGKGLYTTDTTKVKALLIVYDGAVIKKVETDEANLARNRDCSFEFTDVELPMSEEASPRVFIFFVDAESEKPVAQCVEVGLSVATK